MLTSTLIALLLGMLSYSMLNVGLVLEKRGATQVPNIEDTKPLQNIRNFLKNPIWLIGFMLTNLEIIPFGIALGYGPISLVTPMMGFGMVVLILFSRLYLGEQINTLMYVGMGIIIVGIILIGITSREEEQIYTLSESVALMLQPGSILVLVGILAGIIIPSVICFGSGFRLADVWFGIASAFAYTVGALFLKLVTSMFAEQDFTDALLPNLCSIHFYLFIIILVAANTGAMVLQQYGFQKGKAIILAPIFTVGTIVIPGIMGIVIFNEWNGLESWVILVRIVALLLLVLGAALLSFFNQRNKD